MCVYVLQYAWVVLGRVCRFRHHMHPLWPMMCMPTCLATSCIGGIDQDELAQAFAIMGQRLSHEQATILFQVHVYECTYACICKTLAGARAHTHTCNHTHNHKQIIILHTHRKMMLTEVAQSTLMSSAIWSCCRCASIATQTACPVPSATPTTRWNRLYELASISAFMLSQHLNVRGHMTTHECARTTHVVTDSHNT